jgi:GTP-binding protein LepA
MQDQLLDSMDIERERGITIKAQAVRVLWERNGEVYHLNLIDTPGHVDFTYEVSRSLAACEGALLVVDASQGIEAQTVANAHLAIDNGLEIVPVVNKVDLPAAYPDRVAQETADFLGDDVDNVLRISAKSGLNVAAVLDAVVDRIPAPQGDATGPARALVFDSVYDQYRGVIAYIRVVDGTLTTGATLKSMATEQTPIQPSSSIRFYRKQWFAMLRAIRALGWCPMRLPVSSMVRADSSAYCTMTWRWNQKQSSD